MYTLTETPEFKKFPMTQGFGNKLILDGVDFYKINFGWDGHPGEDYGFPLNTEVHANINGHVAFFGNDSFGYGNYIMLCDMKQGLYVIYAHLSKMLVTKYQSIHVGDLIAYSGDSGKSTGPHIHRELVPTAGPVWGRTLANNGFGGGINPRDPDLVTWL